MNKKLIAAAVAAGLAAPMAAQAEITPYAHVQFEIANIDNTPGTSAITVTDKERGRFGVKGSHDLGGGLESFAVAEFDFVGANNDTEHGGNATHAFRIREVNAGIKGGFGSISIGTMKSAYKYTGGVKYDAFLTTTLEARGNGGMTGSLSPRSQMGHNGFLNNAIAYQNKFGNLGLWITYSPDEADTTPTPDGQPDDGEMTAALKFSGNNFEAFVAMADNSQSDPAEEYDSTKVGGQFKAGPHTISAQYEMSTDASVDIDTIFVGYQMKMGKNIFVAQIGQTDVDGAPDTTDYMAIGAKHKFNKQTTAFVGYRSTETGPVEETSLSVGLRVDI